MVRLGELRDALTSSIQIKEDGNSENQCAVKSEPIDNTDTCESHDEKEIQADVKQESSSSFATAANEPSTATTAERLSTATAISDNEKKRTHEDMEDDDELDESEDVGSPTSSIVSSVARGSDACPPVEEIAARRRSSRSLSRKKKKYCSNEGLLQPDSRLSAHENKRGAHNSSSTTNIPDKKRKIFEGRLVELAAYKAKHGNCNVPSTRSSKYYSLGKWRNVMRGCYKKIQEGKTSRRPLSQNQIGRLEALGFK